MEYIIYGEEVRLDYDIIIKVNGDEQVISTQFIDIEGTKHNKIRGEQASKAKRIIANWREYC